LALVLCKAIFSPSKWGVRRLSVHELASVYDVSPHMIPTKHAKLPQDTADLPFLFSTPAELLLIISKMWSPLSSQYHVRLQEQNQPRVPSLPTNYPSLESNDEGSSSEFALSVKADDAAVPVHIWNARVWAAAVYCHIKREQFEVGFNACPLDSVRTFLLRVWRWHVTRSLVSFLG
jgi:hypothetical protein